MALTPRTSIGRPVAVKRQPDPRRHKAHREFIASLPCAACGIEGHSQAAHLRARLLPGMAAKSHDRHTTPLCCARPGQEGCHGRQGRWGEEPFWADLGIDPWALSEALWRVSGDEEAARRIIYRARQGRNTG
jgi:hypothetical protein